MIFTRIKRHKIISIPCLQWHQNKPIELNHKRKVCRFDRTLCTVSGGGVWRRITKVEASSGVSLSNSRISAGSKVAICVKLKSCEEIEKSSCNLMVMVSLWHLLQGPSQQDSGVELMLTDSKVDPQ